MQMNQDLDFGTLDYRALSADRRHLIVCRAQARARAERSAMLRGLIAAAIEWCRDYRLRRRRRLALEGLSDRTLADIGVSRCEIDSLAFGGRA